MKIYIAGPMRTYAHYNREAFMQAEGRLLSMGHRVVNPHRLDGMSDYPGDTDWDEPPPGFDMKACIRRDIDALLDCDALLLLTGWSASTGAVAEFRTAVWAELKVYHADVPADWTLLEERGRESVPGTKEPVNETVVIDPAKGEMRVVDPSTGGEKGTKVARFDLIPPDSLWDEAEHFGKGAQKYEDRNWERGYRWSLSYAACQRHLNAFWSGEDIDKETGSCHLIAALWHCRAMHTFWKRGLGTDDRSKS